MDPLYLSVLMSAEKKFWRCVQSGEPPHLINAEPPRPRIEAVRIPCRSCGSTSRPIGATSPRPSTGCGHACSSSIPSCGCTRIDENASGEVAPLLAYLRELQRRYGVAVLVVHHAKKGGAGVRAGQALRGSSEFHAWGDSNLYLRRDCDELSLTVEHRAAPSPRPLIVELAQQGLALALEVVEREKPVAAAAPSLDERITTVLAEAQEALPFADLRAKCRVRAATLHQRIGLLATAGRIVKTADGYRLTER